MLIENLSPAEQALHGATHKVAVKHTDLSATESTALTLNPFTFAAQTLAQFVSKRIRTNFDGGATSELTMAVGYDYASGTDDTAAFAPAESIHEDGTEIPLNPLAVTAVTASTVDGTYGTEESDVINSLRTKVNSLRILAQKCFVSGDKIALTFTATGANLSALTAGEVWLYFRVVNLTKA